MWIEFQKNKSKWNQQHIHDYQFVLERSCFCLPFEITYPTRIIVRNDEISEVEIIPSQKRVPDEDFGSYFTLGRLFDYLEEDIINKVDIITVKYDSLYGFPQYIFVDEDTLAYDDEIEIVIKEFRKLN
ncbi:MAG: hypothetical protein D6732_13490 [Methanobacteriota archaeon]|nr:MAG: hypothetical protein D6732_13490 [Euryarchaeota archaeon]